MNTPIDITGIVLKTKRLTLRPWRESDLADLYEYARVDGVGQKAGWVPPRNREDSRAILTMLMEGKKNLSRCLMGTVLRPQAVCIW